MAIPLQNIEATTVTAALFKHWVCLFGTPTTITIDQGSQVESVLFAALAKTINAKRIRTSPYNPASNGIVERWHRTLKSSLMCNPQIPWVDALPAVLFKLQTAYKEDFKASPAEIVFGEILRIPGEFFIEDVQQPDPEIFLEKHREIHSICPTPHHTKTKMFIQECLYECSYVFLCLDEVSCYVLH